LSVRRILVLFHLPPGREIQLPLCNSGMLFQSNPEPRFDLSIAEFIFRPAAQLGGLRKIRPYNNDDGVVSSNSPYGLSQNEDWVPDR